MGQMYLQLKFSENEDSYYKQGFTDEERVTLVNEATVRLRERIAKFLGPMPTQLEGSRPWKEFAGDKLEELKNKIDRENEEELEFNRILLSLLEINYKPETSKESEEPYHLPGDGLINKLFGKGKKK
jgi:hypothetical protein